MCPTFAVIDKAKKSGVKKQIVEEMYWETTRAVLRFVVLKDEIRKGIESSSKERQPPSLPKGEKKSP